MKIIHNNIIPFGDFGSMNILGLLFTKRPIDQITPRIKRHEGTHTYQQYELLMVAALVSLILCNIFASWWYLLGVLVIPFALYSTAFLIEAFIPPYHNAKECFEGKTLWGKVKAIPTWLGKVWVDAYRDNCFEREAYMNEDDPEYNSTRPLFAEVKYILKKMDRNA